jgi:hypothetical protein
MTGVSGHNIALFLAILAGCTELLAAVWPGSAPQSETNAALVFGVAAGFLVGPVERRAVP